MDLKSTIQIKLMSKGNEISENDMLSSILASKTSTSIYTLSGVYVTTV